MNNIIIHIPKTGGTTLVMNIFNSERPPIPSKQYRHITDMKTGESNCGELFENYNDYNKINIIMFIRNPIARMESEYSFLRNRDEFRKLWNNKFPDNLFEYIKDNKTYNSICKFLLGKSLYEYYKVTEDDYDYLISRMEMLNIIYCITEKYNQSLLLIENKLKTNLDREIINYIENLNKLERINWTDCLNTFNENNIFDIKLYNYCLNKFETQIENINYDKSFKFNENKYHSLFIYCNKPFDRCPISIFNINSEFVKNNKLQLQIINELSRKTSLDHIGFAQKWLFYFKRYFKIDIDINTDLPLKIIKQISEIEQFQ